MWARIEKQVIVTLNKSLLILENENNERNKDHALFVEEVNALEKADLEKIKEKENNND